MLSAVSEGNSVSDYPVIDPSAIDHIRVVMPAPGDVVLESSFGRTWYVRYSGTSRIRLARDVVCLRGGPYRRAWVDTDCLEWEGDGCWSVGAVEIDREAP